MMLGNSTNISRKTGALRDLKPINPDLGKHVIGVQSQREEWCLTWIGERKVDGLQFLLVLKICISCWDVSQQLLVIIFSNITGPGQSLTTLWRFVTYHKSLATIF